MVTVEAVDLEMPEPQGDLVDELLNDSIEMKKALKLVLLFHDGSYWGPEKQHHWRATTGVCEATTNVMCDHIRKVLGKDGD